MSEASVSTYHSVVSTKKAPAERARFEVIMKKRREGGLDAIDIDGFIREYLVARDVVVNGVDEYIDAGKVKGEVTRVFSEGQKKECWLRGEKRPVPGKKKTTRTYYEYLYPHERPEPENTQLEKLKARLKAALERIAELEEEKALRENHRARCCPGCDPIVRGVEQERDDNMDRIFRKCAVEIEELTQDCKECFKVRT